MKFKFQPHNYVAKDGLSLLYLHVWEKYPPERIPLDIYVERKHWDFKAQRVTKNARGHSDTNLTIDQYVSKITDIKIKYRLSETVLTIEKFIEEFHFGIPRIDFVKYFYYAKEKDFALGRIKKTTWKKENSAYTVFVKFRDKVLFSELDADIIDKFKKWRAQDEKKASTVASNLRVIKKYIGRAIDDGIKMKITRQMIKVGSTNGMRESLSEKELRKFRSYYKSEFIKDNHKVPLCRFLFSCFTGMRIGDNQDISPDQIYDGRIYFQAEKTGKKNRIKLNKTAKKILRRCPEVFTTTFTDQHVNRMLQEAAKLLGIKTHVTFHISRHTFATNLLNAGVDIRLVQKYLDHQSIETTMIYSHVNQKQLDKGIMALDKIK